MQRIKVPEGMLKAFMVGYEEPKERVTSLWTPVLGGLEAALRWLSENPIVPTPRQEMELSQDCAFACADLSGSEVTRISAACSEWQRRMFLAPKPEVPEAVKHLLSQDQKDGVPCREVYNQRILEAYRRGRNSKETQ